MSSLGAKHIISQHRLPQPYRKLLILGWCAPILVLFGSAIIINGQPLALLHPRLLLTLGVMLVPAWYFWQVGLDICRSGVVCRVAVPSYYAYDEIANWWVKKSEEGDILQIYKRGGEVIISYHLAHLSDASVLLRSLRDFVG